MSTFKASCLSLIWMAASITLSSAQQLGETITESDLQQWDISIAPDGVGLPQGKGTALIGKELWENNCQVCHGENGKGGPAGNLVGGIGSLKDKNHEKTVGSFWPYATTLFDYIRRAMPYYAPGSLTDDEVYALTAYVLQQNGIVDESTEINAKTLLEVKMPNRDGFVQYWPVPPKTK